MTEYYDIGLNLFCKQYKDRERVISEAAEQGVSCILTGSDMKSSEESAAFCESHDCLCTCGIHPHSADSAKPEDFERIRELVLTNSRIAAIGECGLDYDRMFSKKENQLRCFESHIILAEELNKPLFLHEREASEDFIACFSEHREICRRSVVHCFTGDRNVLEKYLQMGFSIGITGWICDERRGGPLREAVRIIPADRVMAETDAPYLTPRNIPGLSRTNVPQNVKYVVSALAECMGTDEKELKVKLRDNTRRFFGIAE